MSANNPKKPNHGEQWNGWGQERGFVVPSFPFKPFSWRKLTSNVLDFWIIGSTVWVCLWYRDEQLNSLEFCQKRETVFCEFLESSGPIQKGHMCTCKRASVWLIVSCSGASQFNLGICMIRHLSHYFNREGYWNVHPALCSLRVRWLVRAQRWHGLHNPQCAHEMIQELVIYWKASTGKTEGTGYKYQPLHWELPLFTVNHSHACSLVLFQVLFPLSIS